MSKRTIDPRPTRIVVVEIETGKATRRIDVSSWSRSKIERKTRQLREKLDFNNFTVKVL